MMGPPLTRLKERRKELDLSHEAFGSKVGVSAMTVYRWEKGDSLPRRRFWPKLVQETGLLIGEIIETAPAKKAEAAE